MNIPPPVQHALTEIPAPILAAMSAGLASAMALAEMAWHAFTGQVPSPEQAGQWSFYGVLIVAVIVLFSSLATVIWWGATKMLDTLNSLTEALHKLNETSEKQVEYFDDIAKQAMRNALTVPPR
jgi:cytochrome c-type biogenesis protein CcmH/NrfG